MDVIEYPKMLYRKGDPADTIVVNSAEEERAAGRGWKTAPNPSPDGAAQPTDAQG